MLVKSQQQALEAARSALSDQQYELAKEIKDLMASVDGYAEGQEIPQYLTDSLARSKAKLAEVFIARESLYDIEWHGVKQAPKA